MDSTPLKTAIVIGSVRDGRLAPHVANWFVDQASGRSDLELDVIDLIDAALPDGLRGHFGGERPNEVEALRPRLAAADAFVIVVPEYNRGYPGALKIAIDSFHTEWNAKPVGFVSYGGISGGLRAVEQLRLVFAEVHATAIRDSVSFSNAWARFGEDGSWPTEREGCDAAASVMLDQLVWWGMALRTARAELAYA
jgi:NAD(P)H-dependent FMN reductase